MINTCNHIFKAVSKVVSFIWKKGWSKTKTVVSSLEECTSCGQRRSKTEYL